MIQRVRYLCSDPMRQEAWEETRSSVPSRLDIERGRLILDWRDSTRAKICVARGTRAKICVARGTRAKRRREWRLTWLDAGAGGV